MKMQTHKLQIIYIWFFCDQKDNFQKIQNESMYFLVSITAYKYLSNIKEKIKIKTFNFNELYCVLIFLVGDYDNVP